MIKVALCQMDTARLPDENIALIASMTAEAAQNGVQE